MKCLFVFLLICLLFVVLSLFVLVVDVDLDVLKVVLLLDENVFELIKCN